MAVIAVDDATLAAYYAGANGKQQAELKAALFDIIGTADVLDYGSGQDKTWFGFYQTDRMADNEVRDRYSNDHRYFDAESPYKAVGGMNIEHSFPKSWWGGSENQAYKDIHHLMPCEAKINSSKSNYGIGRVVTVKNDNGCTKVGTGPGPDGQTISLWEPDDKWKGDFARVIFYMATCYSNLTWQGNQALFSMMNNDYPTLQPWVYELLLEWSRQDPVDQIERTRNDAVYAIQGNRNPFIDFPDLSEYIWGTKQDEPFLLTDEHGQVIPPGPDPTPSDSTIIIYQNFVSSVGDFTTVQADGTQSAVWKQDSRYGMVGNAFSSGKTGDEWLISPRLNLHGHSGATLQFSHAVGYNNGADPSTHFEVLISADYAQRPSDATWHLLDVEWPTELITETSKFTKFITVNVPLDDYAHQYVNIAFRYTADSDHCWAWEVKNLTVKAKPVPTGIDDNYLSPMPDADAVFDINGNYLGTDIPTRRGLYIVRRNGITFKRFIR